MSFPHHDRYWREAADFVLARAGAEDKILAPELFWRLFPRISRYVNTRINPDHTYHWAILHKDDLAEISRSVLTSIASDMKPVMANEVFVVWAYGQTLPNVDATSPHLVSYFEAVTRLPAESPLVLDQQPVLPDVGQIVQFSSLDDAALARAMNDFWANGGYKYETLRDQTYYRELDRNITAKAGSIKGLKALDVCCGDGRLREIFPNAASVVGVDISKVAIDLARKRHANAPTFSFHTMDAHTLSFSDASFDIVLFIEAIEHVRDAARVLSECSRVLRPGGRLVVSSANTNSLHLIVAGKLGYPPYVTNYQHFREFSFSEVHALMAHADINVTDSSGVLLYPYWGIPGIDDLVRPLTDWDPEVVETLRALGERAGPEYSYSFVIAGQKRA